ncbi:uncharacterized protein C7orf50 homolog [Betta splendens]|uniref:Uncharacterized protein C7orf50 homolog n=1 Tax=Betta splendens TaxID=158456 RepID=A0A6P7L5Y4_BETSP|nr:uncharacterized protein C7orf50 homolog [Betta splendens]XP_055360420.1 uncharacterized protein C7orf50 homolog [Betta splendens]
MAKDKCVKSQTNSSKRKMSSLINEVCAEEITDTEVKKKKKRKNLDKEELPVQMPDLTETTDDKKQKKDKKHKQEQVKAKVQQNEIADPLAKAEALEAEEELSPEEKRVLERKMKKILKKEEKRRLKEAGETPQKTETSGPSASEQALEYLTCWAEKRKQWKFQKTRQTWLLQHMFDSDQVPDEKFSVLLQYLEGLRGGAKDTTVQKALALVEEMGQAPDDGLVQQRAHRAREVIQMLS